MTERRKPVTLPPDLVEALWCYVKNSRDVADQEARDAAYRLRELNSLLRMMKSAGMEEWIPTLEEVQATWRAGTDGEKTRDE